MKEIIRRLLRRSKSEDGNATIEFVIVIPVFLLLFVSIFELGMATIRLTMLEHGLDVTMREIRLGTGADFSHADIRSSICDAATVLKDCNQNLQVEMVVVDTNTWALPAAAATCIDRNATVEPVLTFSNGAQNDLMFIRACFAVEPLYPTFGLGAIIETDAAGSMFLVAKSAFAQEPS
jgi:Flp pilus assembly protein TadG